jgi:hypothetical protein
MVIPRFSLRWLLALTTFCALLSLVVSLAIRGQAWAIGISAALAALVLLGVLFVATFLVAWLVAQVEAAVFGRKQPGVSPFGNEKSPDSPFAVPTQEVASPPPPSLTG